MPFNYQNTPLMVGGRLYMSTGYGTVAALDEEPTRGAASRGVAYWTAGRPARIIAVSGHYLVALDPESGSRFDSFGDGGQVDLRQYEDFVVQSYTWRSPPLVVEDVIVVGSTARNARGRQPPGDIRGYDVRTGHFGDHLEGPRGLPIFKPPYGRLTAIDLNAGEILWAVPNGDGPWDHPAIAHLDLPPLGQPGRAAALVTKTMVFLGEGRTACCLSMAAAGCSGRTTRRPGRSSGKWSCPAAPAARR